MVFRDDLDRWLLTQQEGRSRRDLDASVNRALRNVQMGANGFPMQN
jgi:hypothetical protein